MELKHAILGLLSIRSASGYDLARAFAGSVAHFWHADRSQIYRTLDRLRETRASLLGLAEPTENSQE